MRRLRRGCMWRFHSLRKKKDGAFNAAPRQAGAKPARGLRWVVRRVPEVLAVQQFDTDVAAAFGIKP